MIDFRYHLVSLIAVFLALAVGIVLGAGPLRDYIAEALSGQVEQLREEAGELREELDGSTVALADASAFIEAAGASLTDGVLPAYPVSIIALPGVETDLLEGVHDALDGAGAHVENILQITGDLIDPLKHPFRSGISANLSTYMDPEPAPDLSTEALIGAALDQALTQYDPAAPANPSADALAILELLRSSDLVLHEGELRPTLLTVVLTPDAPLAEEEQAAGLGLIKGMPAAHTVIAGFEGPDGLLGLVRTDSDAAQTYATVDSIGTVAGKVILPRALAALVTGEVATYGFADGAVVLPPDVDLKEPQAVTPITAESEGDDEGASDADQ